MLTLMQNAGAVGDARGDFLFLKTFGLE